MNDSSRPARRSNSLTLAVVAIAVHSAAAQTAEVESFDAGEFYYAVLFHELTHWTGHESRLNREGIGDQVGSFGGHLYSKEELVAEMGASYLANLAGIEKRETVENAAAYIQGWLAKLRNDKRFVIGAANLAQKAVDFMLGQTFGE